MSQIHTTIGVLEYRGPSTAEVLSTRPVARRTMIAARLLAGTGATALTLAVLGAPGASTAAAIWFAVCGVCTVVISLIAFGETVFFRDHVGDRPTAFAASAFNVFLFAILLAGWIWLPPQV